MIWISAYKFKGLFIFEPIDAFIPPFCIYDGHGVLSLIKDFAYSFLNHVAKR